jgi:hypothetical protein
MVLIKYRDNFKMCGYYPVFQRRRIFRLRFFRLWHRKILEIDANVLKEHAASNFKV